VLIPCFNDELNIVETVRNVSKSSYPQYEILVVNDGSTDATPDVLRDAFQLISINRPPRKTIQTASVRWVFRSRTLPNVWVIDKENGGKADTLNAGLLYSSYYPQTTMVWTPPPETASACQSGVAYQPLHRRERPS
jgi:glycosyltransferase involved in cell wall biosynthesis